MDPLTALSLASNIIQLIDFTSRVVSNCRGIYKSADGALPEHRDLELVTEDIQRLSKRLAEKCGASKMEQEQNQSLRALSEACISVSNEILQYLDKHKVEGGTPGQRKWRSFRESLETVWSKKDLEGLASRLNHLNAEMSLHILVAFKEQFDLEAIRNSRRFEWLDYNTKYMVKELSQNRLVLDDKLDKQAAEEQHAKTRQIIIDAVRHYLQDESKRAKPVEKLNNFDMLGEEILEKNDHVYDQPEEDDFHSTFKERQERKQKLLEEKAEAVRIGLEKMRIKCEVEFRRSILASLTYPTTDNRSLAIPDAHTQTFDWIFGEAFADETPWSSFRQWLTKGSGIYWINGKAGSGKSTLMRHISRDPRTRSMLQKWSNDENDVTVADFFFWNGGGSDQSSQLGLLRAVVYKILSKNEKLVPVLFPTRYQNFPDSLIEDYEFQHILTSERHHRWTILELKQAFQRLLREDFGYLCLFIDGLDEYSGDPIDTITWFKSTISRKIKICISSRPWVVFEEAFSYCPQLKLQDLTRGDIETYINDTLCRNKKMKELYISEALEAPRLVQEIIAKASGVFLWVRLVVTSLLRGLMNRDKIRDLQRRLDLLPDELEALFTYMLKLVEPIYLQEGSQILQIMLMYQHISTLLHEDHPQGDGLSAIELSLTFNSNEHEVIQSQVQLMPDTEVADRVDDVDCRLKVRCAGLLEIPSYWQRDSCPHTGRIFSTKIGGARIQWLHRTVKDFLETDGGRQMLQENTLDETKKRFSPCQALLYASILHLKRWYGNIPVISGVHPMAGLVARSMATAYQTEIETSQPQLQVLEEFDRTVQQLLLGSGSVDCHWVQQQYREEKMYDFVSLTEKYNLKHFICAKLLESADKPVEISINPKAPYLSYLDWSKPAHFPLPEASYSYLSKNRKLLSIMLRKGCDPNMPCGDERSGWHQALQALLEQSPIRDEGAAWISIVESFLKHHADPRTSLILDGHAHSPRTIVMNAFSRDFPSACDSLLTMMPAPKVQAKPRRMAGSWLTRTFSRRRVG
ncbi:hypothetical protein ONS95_005337 [Cadophora gregata]|uniref:uncharacterized protein n=1 Tax=Cadophora gregata TaxID=51156 RepID=UPI0026DADF8B|nr:uncharacterized protein ONS95_005337 [Cadophora gregata]KAK0103307.1 hypothetical protein ONS95_005337 [Cadophora gregata]